MRNNGPSWELTEALYRVFLWLATIAIVSSVIGFGICVIEIVRIIA